MTKNAYYSKVVGKIDTDLLKCIDEIINNPNETNRPFWEEKLNFLFSCTCKDKKVLEKIMLENPCCPIDIAERIALNTKDKQNIVVFLSRNDMDKISIHTINDLLNIIGERAIYKVFKKAETQNNTPVFNQSVINFLAKNYGNSKFFGLHYRYCDEPNIIINKIATEELSQDAIVSIINNEYIEDKYKNKVYQELNMNYFKKLLHPTEQILNEVFVSTTDQLLDEEKMDQNEKRLTLDILKKYIDNKVFDGTVYEDILCDILTSKRKGMRATFDSLLDKLLPNTKSNYILNDCTNYRIYQNPNINPKRIDDAIKKLYDDVFSKKKINSQKFWDASWDLIRIYEYKTTDEKSETTPFQKDLYETTLEKMKDSPASCHAGTMILEQMSKTPYTSNDILNQIKDIVNIDFNNLYLMTNLVRVSTAATITLKLKENGENLEDIKKIGKYIIWNWIEHLPDVSYSALLTTRETLKELTKNRQYEPDWIAYKNMVVEIDRKIEIFEKFKLKNNIYVPQEKYGIETTSKFAVDFENLINLSKKEREDIYKCLSKAELKECRDVIADMLHNSGDKTYLMLTKCTDLSLEMLEFQKGLDSKISRDTKKKIDEELSI